LRDSLIRIGRGQAAADQCSNPCGIFRNPWHVLFLVRKCSPQEYAPLLATAIGSFFKMLLLKIVLIKKNKKQIM